MSLYSPGLIWKQGDLFESKVGGVWKKKDENRRV